ncbi:MAG: hypothetical protein AAF518_21015, partial [Spirochaetota bacterium]
MKINSSSNSTSNSITQKVLDWKAMVKASEILTQESILENLKKKILQLVLEYSGAQRGLLVIKRDGEFYIEAERSTNRVEIF